MNKKLINLFILLFIILISPYNTYAEELPSEHPNLLGGTCTPKQVEKFAMTIYKFEASYDEQESWVIIWENKKGEILDLAAPSNSPNSLKKLLSEDNKNVALPLPFGTLTHIRIYTSGELTIRGYVSYQGKTYRTTKGINQPAIIGSKGAEDSIQRDPTRTKQPIDATSAEVNLLIKEGETLGTDLTNSFDLIEIKPNVYQIIVGKMIKIITVKKR